MSNFFGDLGVDDIFRIAVVLQYFLDPFYVSIESTLGANYTNVDFRLVLRLRGLKDSQRKYWPVKIGFRYTLVSKPISVLWT